MSASLIDHFSCLEDPRIERHKRHALLDILVLVVSAVCSHAKGWEAIEDFGHAKLDWLRQFVPLENGVPSHDCIEYVMTRLSPVKFRECFMNWTQAVKQEANEIIAVDGKTARGSRDRARGGKPLHMVTAWACENRLVLCDKDHGRLEIRRYWVTEDLRTLPDVDKWAGLRSIGMVERECTQAGNTTLERRFFIASIPADAKRFAKAVRGHWGIENTLHWRLDVTFSEDQSRIRTGNGPAMMTSIRHLCINLFERGGV